MLKGLPCLAPCSLVVLTFSLGDIELGVQLVQKGVSAFFTEWVIHISLARHNVKKVASNLERTEREPSKQGRKLPSSQTVWFSSLWTWSKLKILVFQKA